MITISEAHDPTAWDAFLTSQQFSPFLQSWQMGEVYRAIGQEPFRWIVLRDGKIAGICFGHIVPAKRGRHLSVPYGPVLEHIDDFPALLEEMKNVARAQHCSFIRLSPFWEKSRETSLTKLQGKLSPLHLLAEHIWYLPLKKQNRWTIPELRFPIPDSLTPEELLVGMRATQRNLIRRASKDGVTITLSDDPVRDLPLFITLHDETRKRHGFTPYTNAFFRAQVERFAPTGNVLLYLAHYQDHVIAASIHMQFGGETSYHHGASTFAFRKIPASYLLQWKAITDALTRGDDVYNFWGIAPMSETSDETKNHPFAGVTLFKTGFGGQLLELAHCSDIPLSPTYYATRVFENVRKWRRGF